MESPGLDRWTVGRTLSGCARSGRVPELSRASAGRRTLSEHWRRASQLSGFLITEGDSWTPAQLLLTFFRTSGNSQTPRHPHSNTHSLQGCGRTQCRDHPRLRRTERNRHREGPRPGGGRGRYREALPLRSGGRGDGGGGEGRHDPQGGDGEGHGAAGCGLRSGTERKRAETDQETRRLISRWPGGSVQQVWYHMKEINDRTLN